PRRERIVVPGVPHHVTQRAIRKMEMFRSASDFRLYLRFIGDESRKHDLRIWAYCLMTNHIHLVVVPGHPESLALAIRGAHSQYARYYNAYYGFSGHLMQARFY